MMIYFSSSLDWIFCCLHDVMLTGQSYSCIRIHSQWMERGNLKQCSMTMGYYLGGTRIHRIVQ